MVAAVAAVPVSVLAVVLSATAVAVVAVAVAADAEAVVNNERDGEGSASHFEAGKCVPVQRADEPRLDRAGGHHARPSHERRHAVATLPRRALAAAERAVDAPQLVPLQAATCRRHTRTGRMQVHGGTASFVRTT